MRLILLEDDNKIAGALKQGLGEMGFILDIATNVPNGLSLILNNDYQLIISDVVMPRVKATEFYRLLESIKPHIPILMITGENLSYNSVAGFKVNYLLKPFDFSQLLYKIKSITKPITKMDDVYSKLKYADVTLDINYRTVERSGIGINLTLMEFLLLECFMRRPETVISNADLTRDVWHMEMTSQMDIAELYINYLRNKIDNPFPTRLLHNVGNRSHILQLI